MATSAVEQQETRLPTSFGKRNGGGKLVESECAGCGDLVVAPERIVRSWCWYCTLGFTARGQDPKKATRR